MEEVKIILDKLRNEELRLKHKVLKYKEAAKEASTRADEAEEARIKLECLIDEIKETLKK